MSAVAGGGNYISDGQILHWLEVQQDRLYGELRDSMDLSQTRAAFADELNDIKAELQAANKSQDFTKADQMVQALLAKYEGVEGLSDLCDGLQGMASTIHGDLQRRQDYDAAVQQFSKDVKAFVDAGGVFGQGPVALKDSAGRVTGFIPEPKPPLDPGAQAYDENTIDSWNNLIGGKLDVASKNDQLTMIHIQELKSTIDQASQLGSSFISGGDKTSSAIINNIA